MFGLKKPININFNPSNEIKEESNQQDNYHISDDSKYIYYNESENDDQFISQFELYIKPNNYSDKKILVIVKKNINFEQLYEQIEENFKSISEFKTISNIEIKNFSKIIGEDKIKLPLTGPIDNYLNSGDIIFCDILSEEIWMKTYFKLEIKNFRKVIKIEYKIPKRLNFKHIKYILLKAGISLFYDEMKNNHVDNSFNFYLKDILFNKKKKEILKNEEGKEYKYEVFVNMHFEIFEELIHNQLKTNEIKKSQPNYFRFNEYSNLSFEELSSSKKFAPELGTIKDISKEFLTSQYNDLKSPFVFYNPKNPEIFESFFLSTAENSTSYDLYDLSEYQDVSYFVSEDTDLSMVGDYRFMNNTTSIESAKSKYKPDAYMIIISYFLNNPESPNSSFSNDNLNNILTNSSLDLSLEENKNRSTMQNDYKIGDNPLYDSLIHDIKRPNKSLVIHEDLGKTESSLEITTKKEENNEHNNENIFFIDEESVSKKSKKDKKRRKSKRTKFQLLLKEFYKQEDCCMDLYDLFNQKIFLEKLKLNYKKFYNKQLIERLKVPESRNFENVDRNFFKFLQKRDKKKRSSNLKYHKKLISFLIITFLYYLFIIIFCDIDFFNVHLSA